MIERHAQALHSRTPLALNGNSLPWLFAFCIIGLTFKQTRIFTSFGPMELAALVLAIGALVVAGMRGQLVGNPSVRVAFIGFAILNVGTLWAFATDSHRVEIRDVIAYSFVLLMFLGFLAIYGRREASAFRVFGVTLGVYLSVVTAVALLPTAVSSPFWFEGVKLQGLSDNPNQIAFLAVIGVAYLATDETVVRRSDWLGRAAAFACGLAGWLSASGAYLLAITSACVLAALAALLRHGQRQAGVGRRGSLRMSKQIVAQLPATLLAAAVATIAWPTSTVLWSIVQGSTAPIMSRSDTSRSDTSHLGAGSREQDKGPSSVPAIPAFPDLQELVVAGDNNQGAARLALWRRSLTVVGRSPLVGLGAGAHIPMEFTPGKITLHEAHNTPLDLLVVSGLLGVSFVAGCLLYQLPRTVGTAGLYPFMMLVVPTGAFALLHFVGRQPLFWITISLATIICRPACWERRADAGAKPEPTDHASKTLLASTSIVGAHRYSPVR